MADGTGYREELGFADAVRIAFGPLVRAHGFAEAGADAHTVHYQGESGWLTVAHEPRSHELDIAFTPAGESGERPFGIVDFLRVAAPDAAARYRAFAASSPDAVRRGVEQLASDAQRYAERALRGDVAFISDVVNARQTAIEDFGRTVSQSQRRRAADEAIRERDWTRVVELYEADEEHLTRVERSRLELARKRLTDS